jgi:hypothetical protein
MLGVFAFILQATSDGDAIVNDTPNTPPSPHPPEWLQFQREMAARGLTVKLPTVDPNWTLPDPIEVEGELASQAVIRLRRTARW